MTLKEKLIEAGIWKGFIDNLEENYKLIREVGMSAKDYEEYRVKSVRFTDQCMRLLDKDLDPEDNPNSLNKP